MTNAELAILGLVAEQPRHGYEIEQVIEERRMRFWTEIGFSSIYFLLKKLEKEGLIESKIEEAEQGPARKVYRLTADGQQALNAGVIEALSVHMPNYIPLYLGIRNMTHIQPSEAITALRNYCNSLKARGEHLKTLRESRQTIPFPVNEMFDLSQTMIKAELEWVNGFIERLQTLSNLSE